MGCEMILSGLSSEAAQIIVDLGIRLADIKTTATLKAALKIALRQQSSGPAKAISIPF